jgi:hypothetical protein
MLPTHTKAVSVLFMYLANLGKIYLARMDKDWSMMHSQVTTALSLLIAFKR